MSYALFEPDTATGLRTPRVVDLPLQEVEAEPAPFVSAVRKVSLGLVGVNISQNLLDGFVAQEVEAKPAIPLIRPEPVANPYFTVSVADIEVELQKATSPPPKTLQLTVHRDTAAAALVFVATLRREHQATVAALTERVRALERDKADMAVLLAQLGAFDVAATDTARGIQERVERLKADARKADRISLSVTIGVAVLALAGLAFALRARVTAV
eukprot:tig00000492_g1530.t1